MTEKTNQDENQPATPDQIRTAAAAHDETFESIEGLAKALVESHEQAVGHQRTLLHAIQRLREHEAERYRSAIERAEKKP